MKKEKQFSAEQLSCFRNQQWLFKNIQFVLNAGQGLVIEGNNGCGKSTLLRQLAGLITPSLGTITWQQQTINANQEMFRQDLHYISHVNGIKLGLTVKENILLFAALADASPLKPMDALLSLFKLDQHAHVLAKELSAGQKRRLALSKLLYCPKPLWLLDEPLTALDTHTQQIFLTYLTQHLQQGGIAVLSSHHKINLTNASLQHLRLSAC